MTPAKRSDSSRPSGTSGQGQRKGIAIAAAGGLMVGVFLGTQLPREQQPNAPPLTASVPAAARTTSGIGKAQPAKRTQRARVPTSWAAEETEQEAAYQEQQTREIVDLLSERFRAVSAAFPDTNPEAVADHLRLYEVGLVDGIMRTAPELAGRLAKHVETALCDPGANDAQLMVMARLAGDAPEFASAAGFDCIFGRGKEDIVLWTALDAWRRSGMPRTPELDELEQHASDSRTKNRLHPELAPGRGVDDTAVALRPEP